MIATIDPAAAGKDADITAIGIEAAIELLRNAGYRVSKPAAKRALGLAPTACACGSTDRPLHLTRIGAVKGKRLIHPVDVALCDGCYRSGRPAGFGSLAAGTLLPVKDPERYARVYRAWRRAHHLYHDTVQIGYGGQTYRAHPRLVALTRALQAAGGQHAQH